MENGEIREIHMLNRSECANGKKSPQKRDPKAAFCSRGLHSYLYVC